MSRIISGKLAIKTDAVDLSAVITGAVDAVRPAAQAKGVSLSAGLDKLTVAPEDCAALITSWADDAAYMKQQPGFITTQLHRGIAGSCVFLNYAVWESLEAFRTAFAQPEFRGRLAHYPASTVASPHLFDKVAVPGICVA